MRSKIFVNEKNSAHFMEVQSFFPYLQEPAICPYKQPQKSFSSHPIRCKIHFNIILQFLLISSKWYLSFGFPINSLHTFPLGDRVSTVVKVLCYKSEGRSFDSRWFHWNFSLTYSFRSHYGPEVESASNRNEYQEYFLGVKAAGA